MKSFKGHGWEFYFHSNYKESPLEEKMAAHFSILAWRRQRSLAGYGPQDRKDSDATKTM